MEVARRHVFCPLGSKGSGGTRGGLSDYLPAAECHVCMCGSREPSANGTLLSRRVPWVSSGGLAARENRATAGYVQVHGGEATKGRLHGRRKKKATLQGRLDGRTNVGSTCRWPEGCMPPSDMDGPGWFAGACDGDTICQPSEPTRARCGVSATGRAELPSGMTATVTLKPRHAKQAGDAQQDRGRRDGLGLGRALGAEPVAERVTCADCRTVEMVRCSRAESGGGRACHVAHGGTMCSAGHFPLPLQDGASHVTTSPNTVLVIG